MSALQVNYFPSRFDPVRHAEQFPENRIPISGARERRMIDKVCFKLFRFSCENQFRQCATSFPPFSKQNLGVGRCLAILIEIGPRADTLGCLQENNFQQPGERFRSFDPCSQGEVCQEDV